MLTAKSKSITIQSINYETMTLTIEGVTHKFSIQKRKIKSRHYRYLKFRHGDKVYTIYAGRYNNESQTPTI